MKRRNFLGLTAIGAFFTVTAAQCRGFWGMGGMNMMTDNFSSNKNYSDLKYTKFSKPLIVPPEAKSSLVNGVKKFELNIDESSMEFFEGIKTKTFGIDAPYLGPTLRVKRGESVEIKYTNNLDETTTMHGHGMHVPAIMDGGPHQKIAPNSSWTTKYKVNQKACTNWYHPHQMGKTAEQVYMGLAGFIIIDDEESTKLDLPKRYAIDDFVIAIQDRRFTKDGAIDYSPSRMEIMRGYKGDIFLANGVINPFVEVEAKEIRFRLLNGSNASVYNFAFSDNKAFYQIAGDNSFLKEPVLLNSVRLSPGERAEIVVDFTNNLGNEFILKDLNTNKDIFKVIVSKEKTAITVLPKKLTNLDIPDEKEAKHIRKFALNGRMGRLTINGRSMNMNVVNERVPLNQLEIWEVTNNMMMRMEHNFHIHGTHFIVLERNGKKENVLPNERGYKDTVYLAPYDKVKLLVKMTDYADANGKYMYHCHFLEHEDAGMMGQFVVV